MPKVYDVMFPAGKYTDQNGQEKTRWQNVGMVVSTGQGKMALKLNAIPISAEFDGWLQLFEPNQPQGNMHTANAPQAGFRQPAAPAPAAPAPFVPQAPQGTPVPQSGNAQGFADDDIPF